MRTISLVCLALSLVFFVLAMASSASAGRVWNTEFLLWSRAPEEWIKVGGSARVPRGADGIARSEATRFKAFTYPSQSDLSMRYGYNFTLWVPGLAYSECKPTAVEGMDPSTVSCRSDTDTYYRFRFVRPSWQTGVVDNILEDGYSVFIQDVYTGKFCAIWPWPSNNAGMKCLDDTPGEGTNLLDGHLFHFHWN
ncbi:hypothetical protein [Mollivirus kamchatka]|nr:hypothetical protein [Mollivirus kamchatka]